MRSLVPIFLIVAIIIISFFGSIINKKEIPDYTLDYSKVEIGRDYVEDNVSEGNTEVSGGISLPNIENLEFLLEYLPPEAMLDYEDYMNIYIDSIYTLIKKDEEFYDINKTSIGNIFGVYNYEDYIRLSEVFDSINKEDRVEYVKINSIQEEKGSLKAEIEIHFSHDVILIEQLLDYIYVKNEPMLFIYTEV